MAEFLTPLQAYLLAAVERPFCWGECDCCLFMADWIMAARGIDPAADLRGRYSTQKGALKHIWRAGGLPALVEARMAAHGLARTDEPRIGDVGLVMTDLGETGAIRMRAGWACKTERGVVVRPFRLVMAWAL
jgi:hypothetical protein